MCALRFALVLFPIILSAGAAVAQDLDPSASYDTRDILDRLPHDVDELPTEEESGGRPVTFSLSLDGTYTSNAGRASANAVDAGYLTPTFGIDVTPVSVGNWSIGGGAAIDGDYYADDYNDDFGEGRIEGFVFAERKIGPGTLTAEGVALAIFSSDFADHDINLLIGDVTYSVNSGNLSADVGADYQHSDVADQRRLRITTKAAYTVSQPLLGHAISIEGDVAFSDFSEGANSDRNDTVVALALIADRELAPGWSLSWEAAYINRFSNRESAEFEAFDFVVALNKQF